jgi:hypothetical protein
MKPSEDHHHQKRNPQNGKKMEERDQHFHKLILSTIQTCETLSIKPTISVLVEFSGLSEEKILEIIENYYKDNSSIEKLKKLNENNNNYRN